MSAAKTFLTSGLTAAFHGHLFWQVSDCLFCTANMTGKHYIKTNMTCFQVYVAKLVIFNNILMGNDTAHCAVVAISDEAD